MTLRLLVLGAGAVGGYFGGRLAETGADVTFLVREPRRQQLRAHGMRIESPFGDAHVDPRTLVTGEEGGPFDAVLLTAKAYDLPEAITAVQPFLAPDGYVLPLLNGIGHIDTLAAAFGRERVLGGTAKIQAAVTASGGIRQFNDWSTITFGELAGGMSSRVETLRRAFAAAKGVSVVAADNVMQRMWDKLVHLSTAATMTCLMRANVGEIVRTPDGRELFLQQLATSAAVAAAAGFPPSGDFLAGWRETFSDAASQYSTSMLRDIERGGRVEADHIVGFMLDRARDAKLDHQTLLLAYTSLKAYELRRANGRLG